MGTLAPELLIGRGSTLGLIWAQRTTSSEGSSLSAVLVCIFSLSLFYQRLQLFHTQTELWSAFPSSSNLHSYLPFSPHCPLPLSPSRLFPHLTHSIHEDLSVRILAFNVSLLCMRSSNSCLPPTERSQHITAGRSAPVSTIRACVAAPAQAPLLPGPSPLTYCAHPKATHPSLRGYYHPLRYISLCLSHTHLFSQVLIIIYLLNKTLPMPPGQVNLLRINVSLSLEE